MWGKMEKRFSPAVRTHNYYGREGQVRRQASWMDDLEMQKFKETDGGKILLYSH